MSLTEICDLIKCGSVVKAKKQVQALVKNPSDSYLILLKLNSVCYKNIPELSAPGAAQAVFSLADFLCGTVQASGDDFPKIVQPLYHITNYLLKFDPMLARHLCKKYFFQVEALRIRRKIAQTKEEQAVYCNLLHIFSNKLLDRFNRLEINSGEDSVESWLEFTFRLSRMRSNDTLNKIFQVLHTILVKCSGNRLNEYIKLCFSKVNNWLAEVELNGTNSTGIIESFAGLVQLVLALVPDVKDFVNHVNVMVDCVARIHSWCPESHGATLILENALQLCQTLENRSGTATQPSENVFLNRLASCVASQPPKMSSVLPIVHTLLYKSRRNFIAANDTTESSLSDIFSLLLALSEHTSQSNELDLKKSKKHLEIVYTAFTILNGVPAPKETLEKKFNDVKKFVKLFCKTAAHADKKSTHFTAGVAELLNVMNKYKRAELTRQSAQMCQYMFTVLSEMDPDFLSGDPYFKNYIEVWLKSWATSCVTNTYGIGAQVMLIIFAQRHPKFTIEAMKAWASLKTSKAMEVRVHATVLDVLNVNNQEIEQNNPDLRVADFDIGRLLLGEAYAYTKSRDLYGEPVLNVYKAAAKATKKDYIALANILCCTVDAFTFDVNDKTHFATLDASVANMIAHLLKVERDIELPSGRAALFCSLGNLYYYRARLERQRIRQKAEAEVSEEKTDMKLPVIRSGEKDALDVTEIVAVGSSLKMNNLKLLEILEKAMEFWGKCVDSLESSILLTPSLSAIKGAGYLFRLYGYKELEASCWNHLFHIAEKLGSEKHQFLAAGELLAVLKSVDPDIISCVESLKFDRKCYACHIYQINFARNLLLQGKVDDCRQAVDKIDAQSLLYCFLANAQYKILLALFNISHPAASKTDKAPLALMTTLFENLMYLIVNNQWETHNEATVVQLLVMETAQLLSTINSDMKYVRPARCYIKCGLPLSKKLALPARVCQVMNLGCWVDLLTWNVTESEINAQEVESLLELGVLKLGHHETVRSPRRDSGLKIVPHFLSTRNCKCQSCLVTDYPCLVLDAICNRVLVLIGNDGHNEAHQVIGVGMEVLEFVKEKELASHTLSTTVSSSVARFYYVVASANALWQKNEEAIRYATVAARTLDSAPVKNAGLDISIKRLVLGVRWTQSYKRPIKPKPVSRRFASGASIASAVTPESIPPTKAGTYVLNRPKHTEKGFYDVSELEKLSRKNLYGREENKEGCEIVELEGISKLSVSPVPTGTSTCIDTIGKPTKTYGTNLHVPNATHVGLINESIGKSNTPETGVSQTIFAQKLQRSSKAQAKIPAKTNQFFKAINNQLHAGESQPPERTDNGSTKAVFNTPPNPFVAEASSSRKTRTEKKPKVPKANILGTPCMASLAKIGICAKTPAIKVYYDPDGLESTVKKHKSKTTIKRPKRLATKGLVDDKLGTPKATRTRPGWAAKEKVTLDEDSSDEIELVSAQFKRLLAQKERSDDGGIFKKPAVNGKHSHVNEAKASSQISELPPKFDCVDKDDTGSTDSFHSTFTHLDDTMDSFPSPKKPLETYSKKGLTSEAIPLSNNKNDSESTDSYISLCSDDTLGGLPSMKQTVARSSRKGLNALESKSGTSSGAMALAKKACDGPGLISQAGEKCEAAGDFDSSGVVAAPFRKILAKKKEPARPIFEETVLDVTNVESDSSEAATAKKQVVEKSADPEPYTSSNPISQAEAGDEVESPGVITALTKTRKARRAIFDDTACIGEIKCLPEGAIINEERASEKTADTKPSKSRKPRRAVVEQPQEVECVDSESPKRIAPSLKTRKPRRAIFNDTANIGEAKCLHEGATINEEQAAENTADPKPSKSSKPGHATIKEPQDVESVELESPKRIVASLKPRKPRRAIFDDSADVSGTKSQSPEELVSTFRKVIGHSASRNRKLFDETTVDLTNETISDEAKPSSRKAKETSHAVSEDSADESDVDATMVAAPFRKVLANCGLSGAVSKPKPVIHDETLDQDEIQDIAKVQQREEIAPVKGKATAISKTKKINLNGTVDKVEESQGQISKATNDVSQLKGAVKGSFVEPKNRSKARTLKLAVPVAAEVDKLGGSKAAVNTAAKSATSPSRCEQGAESKKLPSTTSRAAKGVTSKTAGSSKDTVRPARGARAMLKEPKPGLSKQPPETVKLAKMEVPSSAVTADSPHGNGGNSSPSSGVTTLRPVEEVVEVTSKPVGAGSRKATSQATSPKASAAPRPKRGARAAAKESQPGGSQLPAKTAESAKSLTLKVPSLNVHRKSPDHENVDPKSTATSPSLIDSSVIESSFTEPSTEMKLPLAPRSLAEEMNKLSISSKPAKQPGSTNPVKGTRRNVRK